MSGFEEFLVAFEAGSPAERWRFMEWRLANRSDDEPDDEAGLDADEIAAEPVSHLEQIDRLSEPPPKREPSTSPNGLKASPE